MIKRLWLFWSMLLALLSPSLGQNQRIADSLTILYESGQYTDTIQLELLRELAINHPNPEKSLQYSDELLEAAVSQFSTEYIFYGYLEKGNALRLKGDLTKALRNYFLAADIAHEYELKNQSGKVGVAIGDVYSVMGNHDNALNFYREAISILREENDSLTMASALLNAGDEYFNYGEMDSALIFFEESGAIFDALDYQIGVAYNLGNVGLVYAQKGESDKAENDINEAISILTDLGDYYPICVYLTYMSDIYLEKGEVNSALNYAERSLELAKRYGLKEQISDANLKLSQLYEKRGDPIRSMDYYKEHIIYRDSVNSIAAVQEMADIRTEFEVSQKQAEVDLLVKETEIAELRGKRQRWVIYATIISLIMVGIVAVGALHRYKYIRKTNRIIEKEKDRSENLLLNILPQETAEELKEHGSVKAKKIPSVTVLFTDFIEFTKLAEEEDPERVVRSIDYYFKRFDEITTQLNLEKIKTIGDSYMCAGGLHSEDDSEAGNVLIAAKQMIEVVNQEKDRSDNLVHFDIRIGVHTGPVVAGIVGIKKWQYDIWGDTVNIASRMESYSESGRINISETTYQEVKDDFKSEFRGEIEAKNRGRLKMYFIS